MVSAAGDAERALIVRDWKPALQGCREVLRLDTGTGHRVVCEPFEGALCLDDCGIAVASAASKDTMLHQFADPQ